MTLQAQCSGLCGDINLSGTYSSADILALKEYVLRGIVPAAEHECIDLDDYAGVTMRDLCRLSTWIALGGNLGPDCDLAFPTIGLLNNPGNQLIYNNVIPPGDTMVTLHLDVNTAFYAQGVSLTMRVLVDGQSPEFSDAIAVSTNTLWDDGAFGDSSSAEVPPGYLMGGALDYWVFGNPPPGRYAVARVNLRVSSSPQYREITLEFVEWPPGDNTSMLVDTDNHDAWRLNLQPWVVDLTGDSNNDRVLSAADVIELVNYLFKGGATPYPVPATGDVNCSGSVTSSDIIALVNHVFKSGPALCNVAGDCTINLDQWTCP